MSGTSDIGSLTEEEEDDDNDGEETNVIINTSDQDLKYLCLSTNEPVDICEYPDSNKVMSLAGEQGKRSFRYMTMADQEVDYFKGEK